MGKSAGTSLAWGGGCRCCDGALATPTSGGMLGWGFRSDTAAEC
jgi:hypothetical protein